MAGAFWVSEGDSRRWLVSLIYPSTLWSVVDAVDDRAIHKQWRESLGLSEVAASRVDGRTIRARF